MINTLIYRYIVMNVYNFKEDAADYSQPQNNPKNIPSHPSNVCKLFLWAGR